MFFSSKPHETRDKLPQSLAVVSDDSNLKPCPQADPSGLTRIRSHPKKSVDFRLILPAAASGC